MKALNRKTAEVSNIFPERVLQFGGGNFLRGFVDWIIDIYNEKTEANLGVLVVKPTERGDYQKWRAQDGLFHVLTKGIKNGQLVDEKHLVKSISRIVHPYKEWKAFLQSAENREIRFVISNTTENGIRVSQNDRQDDQPPKEFPAKLTQWLYHRFQFFKGADSAGCIIIPTELLVDNGELLKGCIFQVADNWELPQEFKKWIEKYNIFCNTLVDRIIPGVAAEFLQDALQQVGFQDDMITQGEPYHLWVIEAPQSVRDELPLDKVGLNVVYTDDLTPFRVTKVRILNGAHTVMVPVGYLYGLETVRESVEHDVMGRFMQQVIFDEIIPTLDMPENELQIFANDVLDRFKNPFIKHHLISIALNSVSKFKARVLPTLLEFEKRNTSLPKGIVLSFAALIRFYKGVFNDQKIPLNDDPTNIAFFQNLWEECDGSEAAIAALVEAVLKWEKAWGQDLSEISGLKEMISEISVKNRKGRNAKYAVKNILVMKKYCLAYLEYYFCQILGLFSQNVVARNFLFILEVQFQIRKMLLITERIEERKVGGRFIHEISIPTLKAYLPEHPNGKAIIICPGGGYRGTSIEKEGYLVAEELLKDSITSFVLKYRTPNEKTNASTNPSLHSRMRNKLFGLVRKNAAKYQIDPDKIGILGFSAGGHLAAAAATHFNNQVDSTIVDSISIRPDFVVLIYPIISFNEELVNEFSKTKLLGDYPLEAEISFWSLENHVTQKTPPAFLVHAANDHVPFLSETVWFFMTACLENNVSGLKCTFIPKVVMALDLFNPSTA